MQDLENKKTVGQASIELQEKTPDLSISAADYGEAMYEDYEKHMVECIANGEKEFGNDFYIVVVTKKERLLQNVLRSYFLSRKSCPTPEYDQSVYCYRGGNLEFMWTVPDKQTCAYFLQNVLSIPYHERELCRFVIDFADGTLLKIAKERNNEMPDSNILIK